ncbi:MAG TPA: succinylglutamate desuccinylase/aspartoacylase family protein [Gemmatimonadaceae bacterium]|nr:succinylglutamate desuccinylase/aspartoacylase family protein [Gemmatimonadaceae bacterium]
MPPDLAATRVRLSPGRSRLTIPIATLASGHPLALTVHILEGNRPGPTVGLSAMIHGDEFDGLLIAREVWERLDPSQLAGAVWMLAVANPLAMEAVSRNTPIDMLDMNRLFPGVPDGWFGEQQAHAIAHGFIDHLDILIDLHCGGTFPWVDYCYVVNDEGLSRAFGSALLYRPAEMYAGTTATYAESRGVRCMVVEIGGGYQSQAVHVENGVQGVINQLRYAGVLEGGVERRPGQRLMRAMKVMRPRHGGICVPRRLLTPGEELGEGEPLADIVSPYTFETLETMVAPYARNIVVLCRNYRTRIHPGDYAFMMGDASQTTTYDD